MNRSFYVAGITVKIDYWKKMFISMLVQKKGFWFLKAG